LPVTCVAINLSNFYYFFTYLESLNCKLKYIWRHLSKWFQILALNYEWIQQILLERGLHLNTQHSLVIHESWQQVGWLENQYIYIYKDTHLWQSKRRYPINGEMIIIPTTLGDKLAARTEQRLLSFSNQEVCLPYEKLRGKKGDFVGPEVNWPW